MHTPDLFSENDTAGLLPEQVRLGPQAVLLRGFALPATTALLAEIKTITTAAPPRRMVTPGGHPMSVSTTSCGAWGWITDRHGYRYASIDPESGKPWPPMPDVIRALGQNAALAAGFAAFTPDACLINRYLPGAKMSLHQDKDEHDMAHPIVSVSLGIPAIFQFGGMQRGDPTQRVPLLHGDVVVWGGVDRLRFHGVLPLKEAHHPLLAAERINLTLRRAH